MEKSNIIECTVCMNAFNETIHAPLVLGCGHTFCKECLDHVINGKKICPNCD